MYDSRQNKSPFAVALGDWFSLRKYFLTSRASPNDTEIVIIVMIIVGDAQLVRHDGGIIAQRQVYARVFFQRAYSQPESAATTRPVARLTRRDVVSNSCR